MNQHLSVDRDGSVAQLCLNRPDVLNAFNLEMAADFLAALQEISKDDTLRVVCLTGAGRAFSAGGDIKAMAALDDHPAFFREISQLIHDAVLLIRQMAQPVLAVCPGPVSGVAFGLVTSCDLRIVSDTTTFHAGTTALGLAPNGGLTYFLPRLIGRGRAEQLILTAAKIDARQALEWGLVDAVVPADALEAEVKTWCERLVKKAPAALHKFKTLLAADDHALAAQLDRERDAISASSGTADFREGIAAFLEKRPPKFQGN